jgi:hypothetical protein
VDEFWVCQHCRSLNRVGTGRCYHCKQKFGSKPKAAPTLSRNAGTPPPPSVSLPGGRGVPSHPDAPPAYLSRPVAVTPPAAIAEHGSYSEAYRVQEAAKAQRFHRPHPLAPLGRRVAWALAMRQSVSISWLGYITAGMLTLVLILLVLLAGTAGSTAMSALQAGSVTSAWAKLDSGHQMSVEVLAIAVAALAFLSTIFFSIFIGLSTHNAPGLGSQMPILSPYRASTCWWGVIWVQLQLALGLLVPSLLFWTGYALPGAIAAVIFLEIGSRHLDDPFGWLSGPSRHLPDLYNKLGMEGRGGSPMAATWAACFRAASAFFILSCALPLVGLVILSVAVVAQQPNFTIWQASGLGPAQMGIAVIVGSFVAWLTASIALLVPITIELVERQRTRKTLVRVGRARPWIAHGTAGASAGAGQAAASNQPYDPYGPLDDQDQASLYSPSTTPSSPWSDGDDESSPG